ncbi:MAG: hypothetical protein FJX72_17805, partial [Armatimonadetes bacterium]|nr:hypothetical protein [Armatimonadota bacterium]
MVGQTYSGDFPVSAGAFGSGLSGLCDVFMAKFRPDGSGLHHCTYLGGSGDEGQDSALDVDATGAAYVTGMTGSPDFPTAVGALSRTYHGSIDAFVVKVSPDGSALLYATYLGGTGGDFALAIAVSYDGSAAITGTT